MTAPVQRDQAWLDSATPAQVAEAHQAGELAELLAQPADQADDAAPEQVAWLRQATPQQISDAYASGTLDGLLGRERRRPAFPGDAA